MNKTNNVAILILTGIAALTIAVGIGRFSYTPILPYMISELNLTTTEAGLIASSNYLGYLLGSLIPIFPKFSKSIPNRSPRVRALQTLNFRVSRLQKSSKN